MEQSDTLYYGDDSITFGSDVILDDLRPGDTLRMLKRISKAFPDDQRRLLDFFEFYFDSTKAVLWCTVRSQLQSRGSYCRLLMLNNVDALRFRVPLADGKECRFNSRYVFASILATAIYLHRHVQILKVDREVYSLAGSSCDDEHSFNACHPLSTGSDDFIRHPALRDAVQYELINTLKGVFFEVNGRIVSSGGVALIEAFPPSDTNLWLFPRSHYGVAPWSGAVDPADKQLYEQFKAFRSQCSERCGMSTVPTNYGSMRAFRRIVYDSTSSYSDYSSLYNRECKIDTYSPNGSAYNEEDIQRGAMPVVNRLNSYIPRQVPKWKKHYVLAEKSLNELD